MNKNQNIRFNMDKESDIMAWESLHSKDVGERFKSQNRFVIEAINYYYERVMRIQEESQLRHFSIIARWLNATFIDLLMRFCSDIGGTAMSISFNVSGFNSFS